jgi:hypothetical protein
MIRINIFLILREIEALNKERLVRREPASALCHAKVAEESVKYGE